MEEQFDEHIRKYIDSITNSDCVQSMDDVSLDATITLQKIIQLAETAKMQLISKQKRIKPGKLLLLCVKLNMLYKNLYEITRECNL